MTWVLIIYIYTGIFTRSNAVTIFAVPNFKDEASCIAAGKKTEELVKGSMPDHRFVCVKQ